MINQIGKIDFGVASKTILLSGFDGSFLQNLLLPFVIGYRLAPLPTAGGTLAHFSHLNAPFTNTFTALTSHVHRFVAVVEYRRVTNATQVGRNVFWRLLAILVTHGI